MKVMNIGYNQTTQQYNSNKQNPTAFQACSLRLANDAKPDNINTLNQVIGRFLIYIGRNELPHSKTQVNLSSHVKGEPASLTFTLPETEVSQIQEFVNTMRTKFPQGRTGVSIELTE